MSASGFGVVRVRPLLGRYLAKDDERAGAQSVVVIGQDVWRNRFASDPAILGRTIQLGAVPHLIVGVMPEGFAFPVNHHFWVPLRKGVAPPEPLTGPAIGVFGRLAQGATLAGARAEVAAFGPRAALAFPAIYATLQPQVAPYPLTILRVHDDDMAGIVAMQGLVVSLLVLVCLNVAILVYTRTAMRQAEIGLRTALGASRGRIVAQLFLEALVLSVLAALAGVGLAAFALRQVTASTQHIAGDLPFWVSFRLSPDAVLYAGVLGVLAAAIIGVLPGLQATGRQLQNGLRIVGAGGTGMRLGKIWTILIVAQVGFAVALLPPSVLSAWGSLRAGLAGPGFAAGEFLSAQLGMDLEPNEDSAAPGQTGSGRFAVRQAEFMRRLEADPRVARITFAMTEPGDERGARIEAQGSPGGSYEARFNRVAVNYFSAFDVPVLAGRVFEPGDTAPASPGEPPQGGMVVVNRLLAQRAFGGNALGKRIRYVDSSRSNAPGPWYEIAGIVSDFPTGVSAGMDDSALKVYHAAAAGQVQPAVLALRIRGSAPAAFSQSLQEVAASVDPELQLRDIRSLDEALRKEQWIDRLEAGVLLAVTVSVLLLSFAGIYALMSFTVSQRRREIGIRMALGADGKRIVASIFSRAAPQLGAGAALGAALDVILAKTLGADFAKGNGEAVLAAVVLAMIMVGFLAALGPARRSLRIEPTEALKEQ
jgi:putative ABC transport system permease protein